MEKYLQRTGLNSLPSPTIEGLKDLVKAQNAALSFENLDVVAEVPVKVDQASIENKILENGRGGYCYELNGLLGSMLHQCGFNFERKLCRVNYRRPAPGPKTHLVFIVQIDGRDWLVDAGFGGPGLSAPAQILEGEEFVQNGAWFRIKKENTGELHLQRQIQGEWAGLYLVSPEPVIDIDIEVANHFVSTWERSPFKSMLMCLTTLDSDLLTIQGKDLVVLDADLVERERTPIEGADHFKEILKMRFNINAPSEVVDKAWRRAAL